ncbi:glutamyl-tRNA(Gln) amidotransferase subunit B, mitochondrial isoform X2 [Prorops nasuta]|uniref:glutamyl-tRNA(Gln) amidotransferase subunit B, mitochondrial isoform X2 n=1 Tax=Prorops nasuta TaxID=863751 RepID=UPI0034CFC53D
MKMRMFNSCYVFNSKWNLKKGKIYNPRFLSTKLQELKTDKWKPTIGLEIHVQISTKSKLFSKASTAFNSPINSCVSLFDAAIPGTMPVLNKQCVEAGVLTALALSCKINEVSMFERKHYFYPDSPAGYQMTQHNYPLASNGIITFPVFNPRIHKVPYEKSSKIKQIQLEYDTGRSIHETESQNIFIDLNRAGLPLMELVFEPDLHDAEEAAALVKELVLILDAIGTCSCKMEEGALRVDANVSISENRNCLGTRTELKNIGSIRAIAAAINYEICRQISILESGAKITNETRTWDTIKKKTVLMREKEDNHDYRFMPEPNLPPLRIHLNNSNESNLVSAVFLKKNIPELPGEIRKRLQEMYKINFQMANTLINDEYALKLFLNAMERNMNREASLIVYFLTTTIKTFMYENKLKSDFWTSYSNCINEMVDLLQYQETNADILTSVLKKVLVDPNKSVKEIIAENNWTCITNDAEINQICLLVINNNKKLVNQYKNGKTNAVQKLIYAAYKLSECRIDKRTIGKFMTKLLNEQ